MTPPPPSPSSPTSPSPSGPPPDFVVIGAQKCGTTSLFELLASHPDVFAPRNKEPHYFTRGHRMPTAYYHRLFRAAEPGQLRGEASPTYSWVQRYPECPARLARAVPDVRLILLVRDPVERAMSQLRHQALVGTRAADRAEAIHNDEIWERSSYRAPIEAYLRHFDRSQLHVADLDDLADPDRLAAVFDFLGLDPVPLQPLRLPVANASAERVAVPGPLGRIASTPVGSVVRDLVPRRAIARVKRILSRREAVALDDITVDDLARLEPDRVTAVRTDYDWVRRTILDA